MKKERIIYLSLIALLLAALISVSVPAFASGTFTQRELEKFDLNGDDTVNISDATLLLDFLAGGYKLPVRNGLYLTGNSGVRYYLNDEMQTGFVEYQGKTLYFDPGTGLMVTNARKIDGVEYIFESFISGDFVLYEAIRMKNGFYKEDGGVRYFADDIMQTSFVTFDGKKVYFDPGTGLMRTDEIDVDGFVYDAPTPFAYDGFTLWAYGDPAPSTGLAFTLNDAGTAYTLTGIGSCTQTSVAIPDTYCDMPVTAIGSQAFAGQTQITGIFIPGSVISICDSAFKGCKGLTSVTIPDSVTSIDEYAFHNCKGLTSVTIGDGVTSIGNGMFKNCSGLTSVTIPDSVTSIGEWAFQNCYSLASVTIPDSVTSIGEGAFWRCEGLTSVTIPKSVTLIGSAAFISCSELTNVKYSGTLEEWCNIHFVDSHFGDFNSNPCNNGADLYISGQLLTNVVIPDSVTSIENSAFCGCTSLTSVTIPDGVTSIGNHAFLGCTGLTNVTIGNGVTSIGEYAFNGCSELTNVTIGNGVTEIGQFAFCNCTSLASVTIPDSVTSIGGGAFYNCTGLTNVTIPEGVTSINNGVFEKCSGLTSVTIPDSVTLISDIAFKGCKGLTSVTIPDSVTSIGEHAFRNCTELTSVTIGDGVTSIGNSAFYGCSELKTVYYTGSEAQWSQISIGSDNTPLENATIVYNYTGA